MPFPDPHALAIGGIAFVGLFGLWKLQLFSRLAAWREVRASDERA